MAITQERCEQHPTRNQLYGHLPPITKTIQTRRTASLHRDKNLPNECPHMILNNTEGFYSFSFLHYHHHHVVPLARISLTLSRRFSLSFIASGRSSGLYSVYSHCCCIYVQAGRPAFVWLYVGAYRSKSPMSLSLLFQQCPACLVRLVWIVFVMGGSWPYSCCLVGCYCQDLFKIARTILV